MSRRRPDEPGPPAEAGAPGRPADAPAPVASAIDPASQVFEAGGESPYHAAPRAEPAAEPLAVRVEFVVLDGLEGRALGRRQADVIRKVLQWLHQHQHRPSGGRP